MLRLHAGAFVALLAIFDGMAGANAGDLDQTPMDEGVNYITATSHTSKVLKSTQPCLASALAAISHAGAGAFKFNAGNNVRRSSGKEGANQLRTLLHTAKDPKADQYIKSFEDEDSVSTLRYTVVDGPDSTSVYAIDKTIYDKNGSQLHSIFVELDGTHECKKGEKHAQFAHFSVWLYGRYTISPERMKKPVHVGDAPIANVDPSELRGGIYELWCCSYIDEHGNLVYPTPTDQTPTPTPSPTPVATPTRTPITIDLPLGEDPKFTPVSPGSQTPTPAPSAGGENNEHGGIFLPKIAGPESSMFATVVDSSGGSEDVVVGVVEPDGPKYYHGKTNKAGQLFFAIPAAATAVELFRHFTADGKPDVDVQTCSVTAPHTDPATVHVPDTQPVPPAHVPHSGPAITEANSAIERGGQHNGVAELHVRDVDPRRTSVTLGGSQAHVTTLAASDESVAYKIDNGTALGETQLAVVSNGRTSNVVPADVITMTPDRLGTMHVGVPVEERIHIGGLPREHSATMHFAIEGAAQLADGTTSTVVPVRNDVAVVTLRGLRAGGILLHYTLHVVIPGYWELGS